jgi:hypothetical protein
LVRAPALQAGCRGFESLAAHQHDKMKRLITTLFAPLILALTLSAFAQDNIYFINWPSGVSPQEVGKRVAEHFVLSPHQYTATIHYSEVATWYGALTFASLTHDDALRSELIHKFEPLMPGGGEAARIPVRHHVDDSIFGVVPLEIAIETKDPKYLTHRTCLFIGDVGTAGWLPAWPRCCMICPRTTPNASASWRATGP